MRERTISSVTPIADSDWNDSEWSTCMRSTERMDTCDETADFVLELEHEDEPGKTFYSLQCRSCTAEYTKKHDAARVAGGRTETFK